MKIKYIEFKNLKESPFICHGIFQRDGGLSKKPFDTLNVGLGIGDNTDLVLKNRTLARIIIYAFALTVFNIIDLWRARGFKKLSANIKGEGTKKVTRITISSHRR